MPSADNSDTFDCRRWGKLTPLALPLPPFAMSVQSPCINICQLDAAGLLCTGCLRTRAEIAAWGVASDAERQRILQAVAARRTAEEGDDDE